MNQGRHRGVAGRANSRPGQTAMEYLLLLSAVVVVVLVGFKTILPNTTKYSNRYFNQVRNGLMGDPAAAYTVNGLDYDKARMEYRNYP